MAAASEGARPASPWRTGAKTGDGVRPAVGCTLRDPCAVLRNAGRGKRVAPGPARAPAPARCTRRAASESSRRGEPAPVLVMHLVPWARVQAMPKDRVVLLFRCLCLESASREQEERAPRDGGGCFGRPDFCRHRASECIDMAVAWRPGSRQGPHAHRQTPGGPRVTDQRLWFPWLLPAYLLPARSRRARCTVRNSTSGAVPSPCSSVGVPWHTSSLQPAACLLFVGSSTLFAAHLIFTVSSHLTVSSALSLRCCLVWNLAREGTNDAQLTSHSSSPGGSPDLSGLFHREPQLLVSSNRQDRL